MAKNDPPLQNGPIYLAASRSSAEFHDARRSAQSSRRQALPRRLVHSEGRSAELPVPIHRGTARPADLSAALQSLRPELLDRDGRRGAQRRPYRASGLNRRMTARLIMKMNVVEATPCADGVTRYTLRHPWREHLPHAGAAALTLICACRMGASGNIRYAAIRTTTRSTRSQSSARMQAAAHHAGSRPISRLDSSRMSRRRATTFRWSARPSGSS